MPLLKDGILFDVNQRNMGLLYVYLSIIYHVITVDQVEFFQMISLS